MYNKLRQVYTIGYVIGLARLEAIDEKREGADSASPSEARVYFAL